MEVTAERMRELRDFTGAGMIDCKKALLAFDGHMGRAKAYLRSKGIALAEYKIIDGKRVNFTDEDLIEMIKKVECLDE